MATARQLDQDIEAALAQPASPAAGRATRAKYRAVRRPGSETRTTEDGPGMRPPYRSELGIGRDSDGYKDLYWSRVASEYKKPEEARLRERRSDAALRVDLKVSHAPDGHTPFTWVDWPDPMDARGATAFAKKLVEDGGARYASVRAWVSRRTARRSASDRGVSFDLASFEREEG